MPSKEKLGKRNLAYNNRHRLWGDGITATDVDMLEFDKKTGKPLALIESKFGLIREIDLNDSQFEALCSLARELPVFLCVYYPLNIDGQLVNAGQEETMTHIQFYTLGVNEAGRRYVPKPTRMTEKEWVGVLRQLHGEPPVSEEESWVWYDEWKEVRLPQITQRPIQRQQPITIPFAMDVVRLG